MATGIDMAAGYRRAIPVNKNRKTGFPYGRTRNSVLDIRSGLQPYDAEALYDTVHEEGGLKVRRAIETMPQATGENARSVVQGVMGGLRPNVSYTSDKTQYDPTTETVYIDPAYQRRMPVMAAVHEGSHAFQTGRQQSASRSLGRRQFGIQDQAAEELGPGIIGDVAEAEARRRGGTPTPDVRYEFPSGYQPSLEFMRQQANRFGLFEGAPHGNIDEQLAKNPQWLQTIAQNAPRQFAELGEPTGAELDSVLPRPSQVVAPRSMPIQRRPSQAAGVEPVGVSSSAGPTAGPLQRGEGNEAIPQPVSVGRSRQANTIPSIPPTNYNAEELDGNTRNEEMAQPSRNPFGLIPRSRSVPPELQQYMQEFNTEQRNSQENDMPSLPRTHSAVPLGRKRWKNPITGQPFTSDIQQQFYDNGSVAPRGYTPPPPGTSPHPAFNQPLSYAPGASSEQSRAAQERVRAGVAPVNIAGGYDRGTGRRSILDQGMEEAIPYSEAGIDTSIADFRARRSAQDRAMNLNVGQRPGGEGINPMMPGAAGMGTGPSSVNPMMGDKAAWYVNKENEANERRAPFRPTLDAQMAQDRAGVTPQDRQEALLNMYDQGTGLANNDAKTRIAAMRQFSNEQLQEISPGFARQREATLTPEQQVAKELRLSIGRGRRQEMTDQRLADYAVNVSDRRANVIERGKAKGIERQQRMAQRAAGPSQEDMIIRAAMNGNPAAREAMGMIAQGNREVGIARLNSDTNRYAIDARSGDTRYTEDARERSANRGYESQENVASTNLEGTKYESDATGKTAAEELAFKKSIDEYNRSPEGVRRGMIGNWDPTGNPAAERFMMQGVTGGTGGTPGQPMPEDIAAGAKYGGLVTGMEAQELDAILAEGDRDAFVRYAKAKQWPDGKANLIMKKMYNDYGTVDAPSGWGNMFSRQRINPKTGIKRYDPWQLFPGVSVDMPF